VSLRGDVHRVEIRPKWPTFDPMLIKPAVVKPLYLLRASDTNVGGLPDGVPAPYINKDFYQIDGFMGICQLIEELKHAVFIARYCL
jgi:hypothetical protein